MTNIVTASRNTPSAPFIGLQVFQESNFDVNLYFCEPTNWQLMVFFSEIGVFPKHSNTYSSHFYRYSPYLTVAERGSNNI